MAFGSIKRLMRDRGFGFIKVDDGSDVFFHRSHVRDVNFDALEEGVAVEFETADSDKGPRATWVKVSSPGSEEGEPAGEPEAEPVAEPEAGPVAEPEAGPVAEPEAGPVAEPEASQERDDLSI